MEKKTDNISLTAKNIHKYFGGVKALEGASVVVSKNKLISLIGPNGSGKTTLFNVISCWSQKSHPNDLLELGDKGTKQSRKFEGVKKN